MNCLLQQHLLIARTGNALIQSIIGFQRVDSKMGQIDHKRDKILMEFFEHPNLEFQIRELSRRTKVPKSSVQRIITLLLKEGLVKKVKRNSGFVSYTANQVNFWFKFYKRNCFIENIYRTGLIDYLEEELHPQIVILFGSVAKGESVAESDIDLFVLSDEKRLNLNPYEEKLKHKINILFKQNYNTLKPEIFNNIINGYKLSGYIKIK